MDLILLFIVSFVTFSPLVLILLFIFYLGFVVILMVFVLNSYFYSYLVFLLFISGLVVMFMYLCSVILNEKFSMNNLLSVYLLFFFYWVMSWSPEEFIFVLHFNLSIYEFYNLCKFFCYSYNWFSVFFIIYLFFCLVIFYELIKKIKGPLRSNI